MGSMIIGEKLTVHCNDNASGTFKGPMKVFKIKRSFISFYCIYKGRN